MVLLLVGAVAAVAWRSGDDPGAAATTTTEPDATSTTEGSTTTSSPPSTTTTTPTVADVEASSIEGSFAGRFSQVRCDGYTDCKPTSSYNATIAIRCTGSSCTYQGPDTITLTPVASGYAGTRAGVDKGVRCGTTPVSSTLTITLRPDTAAFVRGAWQAEQLSGTITRDEAAQAASATTRCGATGVDYRFTLTRVRAS